MAGLIGIDASGWREGVRSSNKVPTRAKCPDVAAGKRKPADGESGGCEGAESRERSVGWCREDAVLRLVMWLRVAELLEKLCWSCSNVF